MRVNIVFILGLFVFVGGSLSAQFISKGTYTVGQSANQIGVDLSNLGAPNQGGFTRYSFEESYFGLSEDYSINQFFISSGYSYFVANNLSLGVDLAFGSTSIDGENFTEFYLSPELRYYINSPFFLSAATNFSYIEDLDDDYFGLNSISLAAGYNFFLSSDWAIEPQIMYTALVEDEVRNFRGEGFIGGLSLRYFPGRSTGEKAAADSLLQKGNLMLGGSGLFNFALELVTFINVNPRIGFFLTDYLVLGLDFDYTYSGLKEPVSGSNFGTQGLYSNLFARYYVHKGLFAELDAGVLAFYSESNDSGPSSDTDYSAWNFTARLGYSWFISPAIALEPSLRYGNFKFKTEQELSDGSITTFEDRVRPFGLDFSIHVFLDR